MSFDFNIYSTPLLFGFLQGWLYALLFWWRGWGKERLSDLLFGCLLVAFSFEIWEYMLGFAGINVLWQRLEFFPRNFSLLLPPLAWLYLRAQFNADFRLSRREAWHALPFLLHLAYHLPVFAGGPDFVEHWERTVHHPYSLDIVERLMVLGVQVFYFYRAYRLYRQYLDWSPTQFSNVETVNFHWFRNFLLVFVASTLLGWAMTLIDLWLRLDFIHDWWDELLNAGLIYYLCIAGYAQTQPRRLLFEPPAPTADDAEQAPILPKAAKLPDEELELWRSQIERLMEEEKPWLNPELSLADLARPLQTNASVLSAAINRTFGKNFNDFVNEYRVEAVKRLLQDPSVSHLSLLGVGLECGFNSKSTFNRAFRKVTGVAPSEWKRADA